VAAVVFAFWAVPVAATLALFPQRSRGSEGGPGDD